MLDQRYLDTEFNNLTRPDDVEMPTLSDRNLQKAKVTAEMHAKSSSDPQIVESTLQSIYDTAKSYGIDIPKGLIAGTIGSPGETLSLVKSLANLFNTDAGKTLIERFAQPQDTYGLPKMSDVQEGLTSLGVQSEGVTQKPTSQAIEKVMPNIQHPGEEAGMLFGFSPEISAATKIGKGIGKMVKSAKGK